MSSSCSFESFAIESMRPKLLDSQIVQDTEEEHEEPRHLPDLHNPQRVALKASREVGSEIKVSREPVGVSKESKDDFELSDSAKRREREVSEIKEGLTVGEMDWGDEMKKIRDGSRVVEVVLMSREEREADDIEAMSNKEDGDKEEDTATELHHMDPFRVSVFGIEGHIHRQGEADETWRGGGGRGLEWERERMVPLIISSLYIRWSILL
jgi:hypothetical protein